MTKNTLRLLAVTAALLMMGAGCAKQVVNNQAGSNDSGLSSDPVVATTTAPDTTSSAPSVTGEPRALTAAETDASWETYTSKTFGFTVMTPTKGKYAPNWEMKVVDQNDPAMSGGCYYPSGFAKEGVSNSQVATREKVTFCQTHAEDSGAGSHFVTDDYSTIIGTKIAVMEFTKHLVNASMMDCAGKMAEPYSTSATTCVPFVQSDYQAMLDGIIGTFRMNVVTQ